MNLLQRDSLEPKSWRPKNWPSHHATQRKKQWVTQTQHKQQHHNNNRQLNLSLMSGGSFGDRYSIFVR